MVKASIHVLSPVVSQRVCEKYLAVYEVILTSQFFCKNVCKAAGDSACLLAMTNLGNVTQKQTILLVSRHPSWTRHVGLVQLHHKIVDIFNKKVDGIKSISSARDKSI